VDTIFQFFAYRLAIITHENIYSSFIFSISEPFTRDFTNLFSRISFDTTDSWGYRMQNGSWNGMIGMLQRGEIDIGGTATFFTLDRVGVVQYIQLYTHTR